MKALRWRGVVTEKAHFVADQMPTFRAFMATLIGEEVEVVVRKVPTRQSPRKRGFYWSSVVPTFRAYLEDHFRELVEAFREHYGDFTFDAAHDTLVRLVMNLPEDVQRVSTKLTTMNDDEYREFLFRVEGFLTRIECEFPEAERDPARRSA